MSTDTTTDVTQYRKTARKGARRVHEIGELCDAILSQRRFNGDTQTGTGCREFFARRVLGNRDAKHFAQLDERLFAVFPNVTGPSSHVEIHWVHTPPGCSGHSCGKVADVWASVSGSTYCVDMTSYAGALKYMPVAGIAKQRSTYRSTRFVSTCGGVAMPTFAPTYWGSPLPCMGSGLDDALAALDECDRVHDFHKADIKRTLEAYADAFSAFPQARPHYSFRVDHAVQYNTGSWRVDTQEVEYSICIDLEMPCVNQHGGVAFDGYIAGPLKNLENSPRVIHSFSITHEAYDELPAGAFHLAATPDRAIAAAVRLLADHVYVPAGGAI